MSVTVELERAIRVAEGLKVAHASLAQALGSMELRTPMYRECYKAQEILVTQFLRAMETVQSLQLLLEQQAAMEAAFDV